MRKVTAWRADNGMLENDAKRAKAHDIATMFEKRRSDEPGPSTFKPTSKVDWHVAMELLTYPEDLIFHLQEFTALLDDAKNAMEAEDRGG